MPEVDAQRPTSFSLSNRETQILELAAAGHTDQGIAHELQISTATVGTYWGRIRIKLGPFSRTELVAKYLRHQSEIEFQSLQQRNLELATELTKTLSTDHWLLAVEASPDAMILVEEDGTIYLSNHVANELFGYGDMRGLSVADLIPQDLRLQHDVHRNAFFSSPSRKSMGEHHDTIAMPHSGVTFRIAATLNKIEIDGRPIAVCAIRVPNADE